MDPNPSVRLYHNDCPCCLDPVKIDVNQGDPRAHLDEALIFPCGHTMHKVCFYESDAVIRVEKCALCKLAITRDWIPRPKPIESLRVKWNRSVASSEVMVDVSYFAGFIFGFLASCATALHITMGIGRTYREWHPPPKLGESPTLYDQLTLCAWTISTAAIVIGIMMGGPTCTGRIGTKIGKQLTRIQTLCFITRCVFMIPAIATIALAHIIRKP